MTPFERPTTSSAASSQRLTSMLIRLPPSLANALRDLSRRTRIRQSEYLREAVRDLLIKYENSEQQSADGHQAEEHA